MSKIIEVSGKQYNLYEETIINVLLGFNSVNNRKDEIIKIDRIMKENLGINIITDLSLINTSLDQKLWKKVIDDTPFIAGTVPIYLAKNRGQIISESSLIEDIHEQCEKGVGIITIHPTINRELLNMSKNRLIPLTSRGGGMVANDLLISKESDNIYIRVMDSIIKYAKRYNTVISIGSTFRSATIIDGFDNTYKSELKVQLELCNLLEKSNVQTILETPGHVDPKNLFMICELLSNYDIPIMPLGPFPTDIAFGEDDTAASIGASLMGTAGCADILSVVTRNEHSGGVPSVDSLVSAIKKYEVSKHIINLYKNFEKEKEKDYLVSLKRFNSRSCIIGDEEGCARCGEYCPLRIVLD